MASAPRTRYASEAAQLLGERIRMARRERRWTQEDLAERAGITSATLSKVERGELGVGIGTAFELAALVGVELFESDPSRLTLSLDRAKAHSALLPSRVRDREGDFHDDF